MLGKGVCELLDVGSGSMSASCQGRNGGIMGRSLKVNNETGLLHDGRARSVAEAIAWHGGEGEASRDKFLEFDADERAALTAFVLAL